jgi:hypothetical protein
MDVVKGAAQVGREWAGASHGVGTGLDFDGVVAAGGAACCATLPWPTARRCGQPWSGPGDQPWRLDQALDALFGLIGAHLPLLLASDQVFRRAKAASINFNEPFARLFEDGIADGSLAPPGDDAVEAAELLFNTVCWSYVRLRGRHRWSAERARQGLRRLMTPGLGAVPGPGTRPAGS